ncbi:APC family permease [Agromyces binzhouensis]|uniref:APC family permease n=1 Tax=Agromyces binzhouensis TaxID=1817495 RepID=A0A4Q2JHL6_9MICO|nr:APC family permease [Agromyces binzhouensis]RXZ46254.1 APC family permease [Agromyces binzhouensis]
MTTQKDSAAPAETRAPRTLSGSLGVTAIVFMVVAAASPLTVVGGSVPLGIAFGNGVGFPSLFVFAGVVMLLFSVGFVAMTRHVPKPGAFFTYAGYGLGRPMGLATAYLAWLTYTTVQVAVHGYVGYIIGVSIAGLGGPDLPWWVWTLAVIAIVGVLGYRHIDLSSKVLGVLLVLEVGIAVVMTIAVMIQGGAEGLSLETFAPSQIVSGAPGVGLMFAVAAFIGFEATAIFRDEARDPNRTIPKATYIAVIGIALFYTFVSWGVVMAWGPSGAVEAATSDPGGLVIATALAYLGPAGEIAINVLIITGMFACVLSFHNVVSRYQLSMSNAGVLPASLGKVHPKHLSPHTSSLVQTATAAVAIIAFALLGMDPVAQVFTWLAGIATLGIIVLMAITSIAIIAYFARTKADTRPWNTVVAPILGLIGLVFSAIVIVAYFPFMVSDTDAAGNPVFGAVSWICLAIIVALPVFGYLQALHLRRTSPETYQRITEAISA